ncbi:hypothetical protein [Labrenzia sp. PO1]|uniref:hypothetical protein n=1 Tax=Labrenzia sp. PO1 TaxID=2720390 RepID=UPI001AD8DFAC|nr:hypothetical protein [Labrenzia sp. PO1]
MIQSQQISIVPVSTENDLAPIRHLFRAYVDWLGIDLSYQGFEEELAGLRGNTRRRPGRFSWRRMGKARFSVVLACGRSEKTVRVK